MHGVLITPPRVTEVSLAKHSGQDLEVDSVTTLIQSRNKVMKSNRFGVNGDSEVLGVYFYSGRLDM